MLGNRNSMSILFTLCWNGPTSAMVCGFHVSRFLVDLIHLASEQYVTHHDVSAPGIIVPPSWVKASSWLFFEGDFLNPFALIRKRLANSGLGLLTQRLGGNLHSDRCQTNALICTPNPRFLRTLGLPTIPQKSSRKNQGYCYVVIWARYCRHAANFKEPQILRVNICNDWDQKWFKKLVYILCIYTWSESF